mmetsp:Transcript_23349/g.62745  ORF Transcript_23349/g.62745 Transcript_23349/m.62745 type:complete len:221 (-) Transcript_23349:475-1137(-)
MMVLVAVVVAEVLRLLVGLLPVPPTVGGVGFVGAEADISAHPFPPLPHVLPPAPAPSPPAPPLSPAPPPPSLYQPLHHIVRLDLRLALEVTGQRTLVGVVDEPGENRLPVVGLSGLDEHNWLFHQLKRDGALELVRHHGSASHPGQSQRRLQLGSVGGVFDVLELVLVLGLEVGDLALQVLRRPVAVLLRKLLQERLVVLLHGLGNHLGQPLQLLAHRPD